MKYDQLITDNEKRTYPFGLQTANSWTRDNTTNNFLYNEGSELNSTTGFYDLPYRNYDAALGRFFQVDPLATSSHNMTPYHYANNNPIGANDPSGLTAEVPWGNNFNAWASYMSVVHQSVRYDKNGMVMN